MLYFIGSIIHGIIFGFITETINEKKGYYGGFAWGFFLGIIGVIVVACKSENIYHGTLDGEFVSKAQATAKLNDRIINEDGWQCNRCNRVNAHYVTTCVCGVSREESKNWKSNQISKPKESLSQADEIVKLKNLLDSGAINKEEYDIMKKQLINS